MYPSISLNNKALLRLIGIPHLLLIQASLTKLHRHAKSFYHYLCRGMKINLICNCDCDCAVVPISLIIKEHQLLFLAWQSKKVACYRTIRAVIWALPFHFLSLLQLTLPYVITALESVLRGWAATLLIGLLSTYFFVCLNVQVTFFALYLACLMAFGLLQASQSVAILQGHKHFFKTMFFACKAFIYQRFQI